MAGGTDSEYCEACEDADNVAMLQTWYAGEMKSISAMEANILTNAMGAPPDLVVDLVLVGIAIVVFGYGWLCPLEQKGAGDTHTHTHEDDISEQDRHRAKITRTLNLIMLQCLAMFTFMVSNTALIPISYDLVKSLGGSTVLSGLLVGAMNFSAIIGIVVARQVMKAASQPFLRAFSSLSIAGMALATLATALAASPPGSWQWSNDARIAILFISRCVVGVCCAGLMTRRMMTQSVLPDKTNFSFNVAVNFSIGLGIGLGPLFVSFTSFAFAPHGIDEKSAVPLRLIASMLFAVSSLLWTCTPCSLDLLQRAQRFENALQHQNSVISGNSVVQVSLPMHIRQHLWIGAVILGTERAITIAALEVATSLLLEVRYHLPISSIGCWVGGSFVVGLPLVILLEWLRSSDFVSSWTMLRFCMCICALACVLLFTEVDSLLHQACSVAEWFLLIVADALIFPMAYAASGIADGIAMQMSSADSNYSQQNYILVSAVAHNFVARSAAPPLARYIVHIGSQNAYAIFQAIVIGLALLEVHILWYMQRSAGVEGEAVCHKTGEAAGLIDNPLGPQNCAEKIPSNLPAQTMLSQPAKRSN